jgi:hypothetical protein
MDPHADRLETIPLDLDRWGLSSAEATHVTYRGRDCLRFADAVLSPTALGVEMADGILEADLLVPRERSFHGVQWRVRGEDCESFFVRPHQAGNPDAIQYTPVSHGISSWQLYHGPGSWAPITFPIDAWFTVRIAFAGERAEVFVDDLVEPALVVRRLKHGAVSGGVGLLVGGPGLHVARVALTRDPVTLVGSPPPETPPHPGVIPRWDVSDPFPEAVVAGATSLPASVVAKRSWTRLEAAPDGLADLALVHGIRGDRNTVLVRATVHAPRAATRPLELGFSDRAIVFLNGRALFRGDDAYRTRDYRFLGSIGYWYTLYLPLEAGANDLVVAVSEDFGGWGVQARFADAADAADAADTANGADPT